MKSSARAFFETYTKDFSTEELSKLFTRETPEAYQFFARGINTAELEGLPWHRRAAKYVQAFFLAFTMRLSPARRVIYGAALVFAVIGVVNLFSRVGLVYFSLPPPLTFIRVAVPALLFQQGTTALVLGFLLMNLLVLLEVADRLSLKRDLEVAREIQQAMLPEGTWSSPGVEAYGITQPANTVGGDFYDILPQPDGRVIVALGDVAGKASPAALLMALLLAMMRTLVDEGLTIAQLVARLNIQIARHAPPSRFITLFVALYDPRTGEMEFVNAGQTPPLLRRQNGTMERLLTGGIALGLFERSEIRGGHGDTRARRRARHVQRRHHRSRRSGGAALRRNRAGAYAGAVSRRVSRCFRVAHRTGDFRRGRAAPARFAAGRRPHGSGPQPPVLTGWSARTKPCRDAESDGLSRGFGV